MNLPRISALVAFLLVFFTLTACARDDGFTNISNQELEDLLHKGVTLVDIRRPEEWRQTGVVEGSHMITLFNRNGRVLDDFVPRLAAAAPADQPVILICRTGTRTRAAATTLVRQLGYQQVYNVTLGITDWIRNGKPVTRIQ